MDNLVNNDVLEGATDVEGFTYSSQMEAGTGSGGFVDSMNIKRSFKTISFITYMYILIDITARVA